MLASAAPRGCRNMTSRSMVLRQTTLSVRFLTDSKRPRRAPRKKPGTTKDRLRSARPSLQSPQHNVPEKIASPQELADRAVHRLQLARSTLQEAWNSSGSGKTSDAVVTTTISKEKGLVMDSNWWFWNVLLAISPAVLIGVYCQFIVIPQMMEQNKDLMQEEAAKLTWMESLQQLVQYLKGEELHAIQEEGQAGVADKSNTVPNAESSKTKNSAVHQQLQELRRQLEQLEEEIRHSSPDEEQVSAINANSNIRLRYAEEQRKQRRMQQAPQQQQSSSSSEEDAPSSPNESRLKKMARTVQGWWSQYMDHMRDAPPEAIADTHDSAPPSPATTKAAILANKDDDIILPSPPVQPLPTNSKKACKITRSITHPRDQESEHPLWTLWHKPTD